MKNIISSLKEVAVNGQVTWVFIPKNRCRQEIGQKVTNFMYNSTSYTYRPLTILNCTIYKKTSTNSRSLSCINSVVWL